MMKRNQRILDPIHGLITFDGANEIDMLVWTLLDKAPLQRLRRIKQLGFAEFVFPGATHSRFSHSIGVFHMARRLTNVVAHQLGGQFDEKQAGAACVAALLHDLGHGPFSHGFEKSEARRLGDRQKPHESWTIDIIQNDKDIAGALHHAGIMQNVIDMIDLEKNDNLYTSIVSSQFDADRLDYLRRDRYMSGIGSGGFDCDWLLDCLKVSDDGAFYLNHKSAHNAEEYLLARYNLYLHVYTHKTARAAEMMLAEILCHLARQPDKSGLAPDHPLMRYYEKESIENYLALDDMAVWHGLYEMADKAQSETLRRLSADLRARRFYKAFDAGRLAEEENKPEKLEAFLTLIRKQADDYGFLIDEIKITAYGVDADSNDKIKIGAQKNGGKNGDMSDIADVSAIVRSIPAKKLCRIYADEDNISHAHALWQTIN